MTENKKTETIKKIENAMDKRVIRYMKGDVSLEKCEEHLKYLLDELVKREIITKKNRIDLYKRADNRTLTEFFAGIKKNYKKEVKFCDELVSVFKRNLETVYCKNYGNLDKARVRILNYDSEPDIIFGRNDKEMKMDIKRLKEQIFKLRDLGIYVEKKAGMIVKSNGYFWIYSPESVRMMYKIIMKNYNKYVFKYSGWGNKEVVKMGREEGDVPLDKLIEKKMVEKIGVGEWVIN